MSLRILNYEGKTALFSKSAFKIYFRHCAEEKGLGIEALQQQIAREIGTSADSVAKWYGRGGGPGSAEMVVSLAGALGLPDPSLLLNFPDGGDHSRKLTDRQKTAAKKVYDKCILFLSEYEQTHGYQDLPDALLAQGDGAFCRHLDQEIRDLELVLDQEYFDLHGTELYEQLCEYTEDTLKGLYEDLKNKKSPEGSGDPELAYEMAYDRLLKLIDLYVWEE